MFFSSPLYLVFVYPRREGSLFLPSPTTLSFSHYPVLSSQVFGKANPRSRFHTRAGRPVTPKCLSLFA